MARPTATVVVTGDRNLDRRIRRLAGRGASRAAAAGIRAALAPVAQALRKAVTASDASADLKRAARRTIKSRFARAKFGANKGQKQAKVGFGVGSQRKSKRSGNNRGGVGVDSANIHWFVLGTRARELKKGSYAGPPAGQPTGRVEAVFAGMTEEALNSSQNISLAKAREKITQIIDKEARK